MTNGDRIRQMTDEELAELIANENDFCSLCAYKSDTLCYKQPKACTHGFYEWLKQEVSDETGRLMTQLTQQMLYKVRY